MIKIVVIFLFLLKLDSCVEVQHLRLTSLPDVLFSGKNQTILKDSVIWLYCLVGPKSPTLEVTWSKNGEPLVQDVPHIRLRNSGSDADTYSTFILIVDKFQTSDSGAYQCIAQDEDIVTTGRISNLIVNASQEIFRIITHDILTTFPFPYTNRMGYLIGTVVSYQYVVSHVDDDGTVYQRPSVLWLKDGNPLRYAPVNIQGMNGDLTTTISFTFTVSDAGVYQCVFTDTTRSIFLITDPIRLLDSGQNLRIRAVSPPITILRPPEKLVLEVAATGRYNRIKWTRNGNGFQSVDFDTGPENFANFFEVYFNRSTSAADLGVYEVMSFPEGIIGQMVSNTINFLVIQSIDVSIDVSSGADASVYEGGNVDISCTSTGVPVPTNITWTFNNQPTSFLQSDVYTNYSVNSDAATHAVAVLPGSVVSTLHIVNAQYPADAGEYMCMSFNTHAGVTANSSATIPVQFIGLLPLVVTSFPEILFTEDVVEGSEVRLYCQVNSLSPGLTVSWEKDGQSLVQDVPHIITRRAGPSVFTLVLNDLRTSDSGVYQCSALDEDSRNKGVGTALTLIVSASTTDTLQVLSNDVDVDSSSFPRLYFANRAAYSSGETATISYTAGYQSQSSFITTPEVTWLKDGVPITHIPTNSLDSRDRLTTTISFTFTESDAGVYQCIFTDTIRSELVLGNPIRIDTGSLDIEALSPDTIVFHPPDKLVMEVRAAGEYYSVEWNKNGRLIQISSDDVRTSFPHFSEIYLIEPTTSADAGVYEIFAQTFTGLGAPTGIQFVAIELVDANTSVSSEGAVVNVTEREFVDISCTSTGIPVPSITWTLNNQSVAFTQTDVSTAHRATVSGTSTALTARNTEGNVVSTLHVINPQYPANAGDYVCTGSNSNGVTSTSATITVNIPVPPEVSVREIGLGINLQLGDTVILTCNVTGGYPTIYTYTWIHVDTFTTLTAETSPTLHFSAISVDELGTYRCEVSNEAGMGADLGVVTFQGVAQTNAPQFVSATEGGSVNISCTSSGIPIPTITWTFNGQPVPYTPTYRSYAAGMILSSLIIANLQYSVDDGAVYTCTGSNIHGEDSSLITLQVLVLPEIEVTTDRTTVGLLDDVTLTCVVNRAVPMPNNYTWIHVDTDTTLVEETNSSTYTFAPFKDEIGTYRCEVITEAGYGMDTIAIELEELSTLSIISLPDVLFLDGSQNILEGSVVWLYCLTIPKSPAVTVTWNKDGKPLVQDVPHIRLRSTGSDADMYSTFLLVIEPVDVTDGGVYQCSAQEGENIAMGPALTITVDRGTGSIVIERLIDYIVESHQSGDMINLDYFVGSDDSNTIPSVFWLKDGLPSRTTPTNTPLTNSHLTTELIFTFTESDSGTYQLVSLIQDGNGHLTVSSAHPVRLNTGEAFIEAVSPSDTVTRLTEKLVLEVRTSGRYRAIEWRRNGILVSDSNDDNLAHFGEVYIDEDIGISDFGVYDVTLSLVETSQVSPMMVQFTVTQYDNARIISSEAPELFILEGENLDISCISTGTPAPIVTWTLNNQLTSFTQTDTYTNHSVTRSGASQAVVVTQGNVVSTLHIVNVQYPADTGVYVCIGSNTYGDSIASSYASISVNIPVSLILAVDVTADRTRVGLGGDVTLTCSVSDGNPLIFYTYTWTHVNTFTTLTAETSPTLILSPISMDEFGTYRCVVRNEIYVGADSITIELGFAPVVTARVSPPGPVIEGFTVNLVCEATAGDLPISFSWTGPRANRISSGSNGILSMAFRALEDYGNYTCTATNTFGTDSSQVEIERAVPNSEMRLCLSALVSNCAEWINVNSSGKMDDLEEEILIVINERCQCNIKRNQIISSQFICSSQSYASFFFAINGQSQVYSSELLSYLESWVASGAKVMVHSQLLDIEMGICRNSSEGVGLSPRAIAGITFSVITTISLLCILSVIAVIHFKHGLKNKVLPRSRSPSLLDVEDTPHPPHFLPPLDVTPILPDTTLRMPSPLPSLAPSPVNSSHEMSTPLSVDLIPPFVLSSASPGDQDQGQLDSRDHEHLDFSRNHELLDLSRDLPALLSAADSMQTLSTDFRL